MGEITEAFGRTFARRGHNPWSPIGVVRRPCGCKWDNLADRMWEPCMAHQAEGHLSAVSEADGLAVARCLVGDCPWQSSHVSETHAVLAAQEHWRRTSAGERRGQ